MYKTLGKIDLENEELMICNPPKFTNQRKRVLFEKARNEKSLRIIMTLFSKNYYWGYGDGN